MQKIKEENIAKAKQAAEKAKAEAEQNEAELKAEKQRVWVEEAAAKAEKVKEAEAVATMKKPVITGINVKAKVDVYQPPTFHN